MAPEKKPHLQPSPSWSVIPLELAGLVLRLLPVYADRACFAAVLPAVVRRCEAALEPTSAATAHSCRREAAPASVTAAARTPQWHLLQPPLQKALTLPWMWLCRLRKCLRQMARLPACEKVTLPALLSVRLRPPNAFPDWSYKYGTRFPYPYYTWMHMEVSEKLRIRKLILCSANLVAALVGIRRSQILICQPGALTWSVLAHHELKRFEDMAFYKGRLYVITNDENLLVVNISQDQSTGDPLVSKIGRVIKEKGDHGCYETLVVRDKL
uniref:Uncharacterized protein n=1 Tax=Avena sativa TaxID=4498 RepID=A0ACD5TZR8_AVESA